MCNSGRKGKGGDRLDTILFLFHHPSLVKIQVCLHISYWIILKIVNEAWSYPIIFLNALHFSPVECHFIHEYVFYFYTTVPLLIPLSFSTMSFYFIFFWKLHLSPLISLEPPVTAHKYYYLFCASRTFAGLLQSLLHSTKLPSPSVYLQALTSSRVETVRHLAHIHPENWY